MARVHGGALAALLSAELQRRNPSLDSIEVLEVVWDLIDALKVRCPGNNAEFHLHAIRERRMNLFPMMGITVGSDTFIMYFRHGKVGHTVPHGETTELVTRTCG